MSLALIRRLSKGSPLTATEHDGNLNVLETAIEDRALAADLGTAALLNVPTTGDASNSQVVKGSDTRLSDSRTPTAHTQPASTISDSTAAGRAILTAVDAAAQRTSLGLGTAATTASTDYAPIAHVGSSGTAHAIATTTVAGFLSATDKTKLDAITVDSGTLLVKYVRNNTASSIAKGTPVYITGSSGTTLTVAPSDATDETSSARTIGVTQTAIGSNSNGYIVCVGLLDGINTITLTEGQLIWLSETTGQFTSTQPAQPAHGVICGYCVKQGSGASGILYIKIDNGYELGELHNVVTTGSTTDQALVLASDGLWKNRTVYSSTTPAALGTAAVGVGSTLARADHVHQLPTASALGLATVATSGAYADLSGKPTLGTAAATATTDYATAAQGIDSREWSADTIDQAEAEAGTATTRRAFTAQRVLQAAAAWWAASAAATKLAGIASGATANSSDSTLLARGNHTGTQAFSTLTAAPIEIGIACSDEVSSLTTGTAKVTFRMPLAMTLTAVRLNVNTAPTGSALVVNVLQNGSSVFSTKPQIDAGSRSSVGSGTTQVISVSALTSDAEMTINLDQIGSTIAGKGLKVWLIGTRA